MPATDMLRAKWFWFAMACVLSWGGWAMLAKLGSVEIPPTTMQFLFILGSLPVCLALLAARRFNLETNAKGIFYAVLSGLLSGVGGLALFAAFHTNGNTAIITASTALYPLITVVLAVTILRERFGVMQVVGLGFAAAAFVLFSF